jgi:hypothetical protein
MIRAMRTLALVAIAVVLVGTATFWFSFGTLQPCEALRAEVRRVARAQGGALAGKLVGSYADAKIEGFSPPACLSKAVRLKLHGKQDLARILTDEN